MHWPVGEYISRGMIFEFKVAASEQAKDMRRAAKEGLEQIEERDYSAGIPDHVHEFAQVGMSLCRQQ